VSRRVTCSSMRDENSYPVPAAARVRQQLPSGPLKKKEEDERARGVRERESTEEDHPRAHLYTRIRSVDTRIGTSVLARTRSSMPHPLREDGMVSRLVYIGLGLSSWCQFSLVEDHPPRGSSARVSSSRPLASNSRRASRRVPLHPSSKLRRGDSVV